MSIFAIIANVINKILSFSFVPQIGISSTSEKTTGGINPPEHQHSWKKRCLVTIPETVNARFFDTGSPAWANQVFTVQGKTYRGIHGGTDYIATIGSPVFNPFPMRVLSIGHYSDEGRFGDYVIGQLETGEEYYSGHLQHVTVHTDDILPCGTKIGETNQYNHTHIQIKRNGEVIDPETMLT